MLLTACDPEGEDELVIQNETTRQVSVKNSGDSMDARHGTMVLDPGADTSFVFPVTGGTWREGAIAEFVNWVYGDSVQFLVDGEVVATYYRTDTLSDNSPYNFNSKNYQYSEKYHEVTFKESLQRVKFVFSITDQVLGL